jgi:exonuclease SbcD
MSISIAHFSDLHYADTTLDEVDRCFTCAVSAALDAGVDVAIITGDTTDHALQAHSPAVIALARQIRRLADHCPVLLLQGTFSHEPPGVLALFALLGSKHEIHVADRLQQVALRQDGQWIVSEGWRFAALPAESRLLCTCVPTLNRAALAAALGAEHAATAMGEQLASVLAGYAPGHLAARAGGVPALILSHGTVHGCLTEHGVPMAGADHEFTAGTLFSAEASACLLGHIHKHQSWERDGRLVAYPGSIGRLHYGETGDKGFLHWQVAPNFASTTLLPTPARITYELTFEGLPDMAALASFADEHALEGAWVRVRWQALEEERDLVDRVRIAELLSVAADVKLEGRILPIIRARANGIAREQSLAHQIDHWATLTGVRTADMVACLEQLRQAGSEEIARTILQADAPDRDNTLVLTAVGTAESPA